MKSVFAIKFFVIFIISILLISSCTMQKRRYVKGFYIEHFGKKKEANSLVTKLDGEIKPSEVKQYQVSTSNVIELPADDKNLITTVAPPVSTCDTIYFTNGVKMLAKVISAGQETIIYKKCDSNKDEFLNLETSKVKSIHYASGVVADLNAPENPADEYNKPPKPFNSAKNAEAEKGVKQLEKASFWFLLSRYTGFGFIIGFIYATCAKNNLKGKEGYESEFKSARFLHIMGLVLIILVMIPILYVLVMAFLL